MSHDCVGFHHLSLTLLSGRWRRAARPWLAILSGPSGRACGSVGAAGPSLRSCRGRRPGCALLSGPPPRLAPPRLAPPTLGENCSSRPTPIRMVWPRSLSLSKADGGYGHSASDQAFAQAKCGCSSGSCQGYQGSSCAVGSARSATDRQLGCEAQDRYANAPKSKARTQVVHKSIFTYLWSCTLHTHVAPTISIVGCGPDTNRSLHSIP